MAALEGQKIRIGAKVGEEGQLFGSVTPAQVAEAIKAAFGTEVDRRRIDLHGIIKTAGEHGATVSIYRELKANIVVEVVDEKALVAEAEAVESEAVVESVDEAEAVEAEGAEAEVTAEDVEAEAEADTEAVAEGTESTIVDEEAAVTEAEDSGDYVFDPGTGKVF
jgi:hypothetical protein